MVSSDITVEICVGSADDAALAEQAGADRIELNSAIPLGGLTPSLGMVEMTLQRVDLPVVAMLRPRPSGFCYSPSEHAAMLRDLELMLSVGVHGIAFGILCEDRTIDRPRCRELVDMIKPRQAVFHRAFDLVANFRSELEVLVDLGFDRAMSSGGARTALEGAEVLNEMVRQSGDRIGILAAGGIRHHQTKDLVARSGCRQLHAGPSQWRTDPSYSAESAVDFELHSTMDAAKYMALDAQGVSSLVSSARDCTGG